MDSIVRTIVDRPGVAVATWVVGSLHRKTGATPQKVQFRTMLGCAALQLAVACFLLTRHETTAVLVGSTFLAATLVTIALGHAGLRVSSSPWNTTLYRLTLAEAQKQQTENLLNRVIALAALVISAVLFCLSLGSGDNVTIGLLAGMTTSAISETTRSYLRSANPPAPPESSRQAA